MSEFVKNPTATIDHRFHYGDIEHFQYVNFGYCVFSRFLAPDAVQEGQASIDKMLNCLQPGRPADEVINAHEQEPWIWNLETQPAISDVIERQVGSDIVFWSSHLLCKPPQSGRRIPWHQDASYWNTKAIFSDALWIAFDDMNASNGAMAVLPGLHRSTLPRRQSKDDAFTEEIEPVAHLENVEQVKVLYDFPAGGAAIHHTMIPHSSATNTSDRWRRVLVLRYMAADDQMPEKTYEDYRNGAPFDREYYLVRGREVNNRQLKRCPEICQ